MIAIDAAGGIAYHACAVNRLVDAVAEEVVVPGPAATPVT